MHYLCQNYLLFLKRVKPDYISSYGEQDLNFQGFSFKKTINNRSSVSIMQHMEAAVELFYM